MKSIRSKLMMAMLIIGVSGSLTGCSEIKLSDIRTNTDNLDNTMQEIIDRNVSIIGQLYSAGLLDESQKEGWENSIKNKCQAFMTTYESNDKSATSTFNQFKSSIVAVASGTNDEKTSTNSDMYPNYNTIVGLGIPANGDSAKPLMLFDDSSVTTFLNDLNRPVYVLNTNRVVNGASETSDLKYLQLALSILKGDSDNLERVMKEEGLGDDDSIANVGKLGELKGQLNNLNDTQKQKLEAYALTYFKPTTTTLSALDVSDVFVDSKAHTTKSVGEEAYNNTINTDVCLASNGLAVLTIRVHELNKDLVSYINGYSTGTGTAERSLAGSYYMCKSSKVALKLDYNMEVISDIFTGSIQTNGIVSDTSWEVKTAPTNFNISIYDGKMFSNDSKENKMDPNLFSANSIFVSPTNKVKSQVGYVQKYTLNKDGTGGDVDSNELDFSRASTKEIDGSNVYIVYYKKDGTKVYAQYSYTECPTVVLRDYLESTYFPNAVTGEKFIVSGRKIRVNKLSGTIDDIPKFAEALTKDGNRFEVPIYISLKDIIDYSSGVGYYTDVAEKLGLGDDNSQKITEELAKGEDARQSKIRALFGSGVNDGIGADVDTSQINEKDTATSVQLQYDVYFNWIRPVEIFGTKENTSTQEQNLNVADAQQVKDGATPTLWCMFTGTPIANSLWSTWIKSSSDNENGSLRWWNDWLSNNKYTYSLTDDMLQEAEKANIVSKGSGGIIIDLENAANVQRIQDEAHKFKNERKVSTWSKMLGLILIVYALLLPAAWLVDVNIDSSHRFLNKLTFGKLEAIQYSSDIGYARNQGVSYVGMVTLLIIMFIIVCVGLCFILVDIVDIRNVIMGYSENLLEAISRMIFG